MDQLSKIRYSLEPDIKRVPEDCLLKISRVSFMENIQNVDEQTNILKAMLKIDIK